MAITARVKSQYFHNGKGLIRLAPSQDHSLPTKRAGTPWTPQEHERFLEAMERYPSGPWKSIAAHIGTRTTRQTMSHAQIYREKIARRQKAKTGVSPTAEANPIQVACMSRRSEKKTEHQPQQTTGESVEGSCSHFPNSGQVGALELDHSVIALLETFEPFEPFEVVSTLESTVNSCTKSAPSDLTWLFCSPFQTTTL